jgi:hypothetical protein
MFRGTVHTYINIDDVNPIVQIRETYSTKVELLLGPCRAGFSTGFRRQGGGGGQFGGDQGEKVAENYMKTKELGFFGVLDRGGGIFFWGGDNSFSKFWRGTRPTGGDPPAPCRENPGSFFRV